MNEPAFEHLESRVLLDAAPMPWEPGPPPGARSAVVAGPQTIHVEIAQGIAAREGGRIVVPVLIDAGGLPVCAASIQVSYDPERLDLSLADVREGTVWAGQEGWVFMGTTQHGWARFIWYTWQPTITETGVLAYLDFTVTTPAGGEEIELYVEPFLPFEGGLIWHGYNGSIVVLSIDDTPLPGDSNLDGVVDFQDLGTLATSYGQSRMGWSDGDSNWDGKVDFMDLALLASAYGR